MRLDEETFQLNYEEGSHTVFFHGTLRMNALSDFDKLKKFMHEAYDLEGSELTLNFKELDFMNSAGISTLCKFIFDIKDVTPQKNVTIVGNVNILWQQKSFENLKKIWSSLNIRME